MLSCVVTAFEANGQLNCDTYNWLKEIAVVFAKQVTFITLQYMYFHCNDFHPFYVDEKNQAWMLLCQETNESPYAKASS